MSNEGKVAIITGANSNLGINIAYRLIDEIKDETRLTIVVTSRTLPRVKDVISQIKKYHILLKAHETLSLEFDYLLVDFTDMVSILSAYNDLTLKFSHIDYVFINAAQGVYSGINWTEAFKSILRNLLDAVTFPTYKIQRMGVKSKDGMGLVFQGNVFGPYYFIHKIAGLLASGGRVIWISSIMAKPKFLELDDLMLLKTKEPYESSKRMIDLLHLGKYKSWGAQFGVQSYLTHPGIFTSFSFFQFLNVFTYYGMLLLFYIARLFGSEIHNISGYTAANAPIKAALGDMEQKFKIASLSDRFGKGFVKYEEIDPTGVDEVISYLDELIEEWDKNLEDQIVGTRKA